MGWIPRPVRRVIVSVLGGSMLLLALIGMILPVMPGVIFIPFALAILAVEFAWAARWLKRIKRAAKNVHQRVRNGWNGRPAATNEAGALPRITERDPARPPMASPSMRRNAAA
jgi:hypothetical protein